MRRPREHERAARGRQGGDVGQGVRGQDEPGGAIRARPLPGGALSECECARRGVGGRGLADARGSDRYPLVADHRGRLRSQGDVRRRPDGDFGYLGEFSEQVILEKPILEEA